MKHIEICCFYGTTKDLLTNDNIYTDWLGYSISMGMNNGHNVIIWALDSAYEDEYFELSKEQLNFLESFKTALNDRLMAFMSNPENKNETYYSLPDSQLEIIFNNTKNKLK